MAKKNDIGEFILKPFFKSKWFWIVLVGVLILMPVMGDINKNIPDDVEDSFYYSARSAYFDFIDGWLDREVPNTPSPEWTSYFYEHIEHGTELPEAKSPLTDRERHIVLKLYEMLVELENYESSWNAGQAYTRDAFFAAADEVVVLLNLDKDQTLQHTTAD